MNFRLYSRHRATQAALFTLLALGGGALGRTALTQERPTAQSKTDSDAANSPLISHWFMENSGRYARVVEQAGTSPVPTWPSPVLPNMGGGQSRPAYADVQEVRYSQDWVYVTGTGLASHQMGPWYIGLNRIFGNWPSNQSFIRRFPRHPKPADQKVTNGLGDLGVWVNGVALFNMLDGAHYDSASKREIMSPPFAGAQSGNIWVRNAVPVEGPTFDKSNAHQPPMGTYHYHSNPLGLRFQLGDNVTYDRATDSYHEAATAPHHSPILGWSYDGFPIYGPYGYTDPKDPKSTVRRMVSGFVFRDGAHQTLDLRKTGRNSLAKWAAALHGVKAELTADTAGPDVSTRYPLGRYCEDYDYLGDLGYTQGKEFDLDVHNGRFCVTPEYPQGTYAYFVTLNADGTAAFPYVIGRQYYGTPTGGNVAKINEPVIVYRTGGAQTPIQTTVAKTADGTVHIEWRSVEGGHYKVQHSTNGTDWTTLAADTQGQGTRTALEVKGSIAPIASQFRITLVSLDPYDTTPPGSRGGPGGGPGGRRRGGPGGPGGPGGGFGGPGGPGGPDGGPGGPDDGPGGPGGGPGGPPPNGMVSGVSPKSASRGTAITVHFTLDADRVPPDFVQPSEVRLGRLKATKSSWDGQTVTATFQLPTDAATGATDVVVVFPGPPGSNFKVTFTGKSAFTVR